jgi:hypothetical protein
VTAASCCPHLPSLAERHFQGAALQLPHRLFLRRATIESNLVVNRELHLRPKRGTYSLQQGKKTVLAIDIYSIDLSRYGSIHLRSAIVKENSVRLSIYSDMVGFTYFLQ